MDTFDAINQRRSVKAYDPNHRLTAAEETKLLEAAIQSPTSFNMRNKRFVVVRDPALRKQIRAAAVDQAQITDYAGKEQLQRDEAMRSCGIAGQTIMLAAKAMGYDSCPILTLWVAVVAQRLGFRWDESLSLGKALAGLNAQSKGRRLGIFKPHEEKTKAARERERGEQFWIELCGRRVPGMNTADGIRAVSGRAVATAESAEAYLETRFGDHQSRLGYDARRPKPRWPAGRPTAGLRRVPASRSRSANSNRKRADPC